MLGWLAIPLMSFGGLGYANYLMPQSRAGERFLAALPFGFVLFTLFLNSALIFHIPMGGASWGSLAPLILIGILGCRKFSFKGGDPFHRAELLFLFIGSVIVLLYAWLLYLISLDGDIYIHYPLISLFRDGVFPPPNPYFPDFLMKGHYACDLLLGALARLLTWNPETAMLVFGLFEATMNFILCYVSFRQMTHRPFTAFLITSFLYFCLRAGHSDFLLRGGLVEAIQSNNQFVILWCLVLIFQLHRFYRKGGWLDALGVGILLGAFGFVYESYLPFVTLGIIAAGYAGWRRLIRFKGAMLKLLVVGCFMMLWATTQGGVFTDLAGRALKSHSEGRTVFSSAQVSFQEEWAGVSQQVRISFPKNPLFSWTNPNGKNLFIFSWPFLRDQGAPIFLVVPLLFYFLIKKNPLGAGFAAVGAGTILITSVVNLGRFNPDTYRLLFLAGLGCGTPYALSLSGLLRKGLFIRKQGIAVLLGVLFLILHSGVFVPKWIDHVKLGLKSPAIHLLDPKDHLPNIMQFPLMGPIDWEAMADLRKQAEPARLLTNFPFVWEEQPQFNNSRLVLSALSGKPAAGFGLGIPTRENYSLQVFVYGLGYRAIAYWRSGAPELLQSMKVRWLYLFPEDAQGNNLNRWESITGVEKMARYADTGSGERLLFKVKPIALSPWASSTLPKVTLTEIPAEWKKAEYREIGLVFGPPLESPILVRQSLWDGTGKIQVNLNDALEQRFDAGASDEKLRVVAPFFSGSYQLKLQAWVAPGVWRDLVSNEISLRVAEPEPTP